MRVRVRTNANKEAFHGKQLTAFLRRRPLTAVTYCYLPNRVRRWKKLADGKRSKLLRGEDGLNLPCGQDARKRERGRQTAPTNHRRQNMHRSFMASWVPEVHRQPPGYGGKTGGGRCIHIQLRLRAQQPARASSVPLVSDPRPTQSNGPPEQSTAAVSPHAPRLGLALDLPPARRDAPRTAPDTWMILVGSGEGKETPC